MDERYRYITKIDRNLELYKRKYNKTNNLSSSEELVIHLIRHNKGINQERISSSLNLDKALITRIIKKLIDDDLIERVKNEKDKRSYELYSTKKAESLKQDIVTFEEEYYDNLFNELDINEKEQFLNTLAKIYLKSKQIRKSSK